MKKYYILLTAFLMMILILGMCDLSKGQSFSDYKEYVLEHERGNPMFELYCCDSVSVEATTYPKDYIILVAYEDAVDDLWFTLKPHEYKLYDPRTHTIYKGHANKRTVNVSEHFLALIRAIREERKTVFFTTKKP